MKRALKFLVDNDLQVYAGAAVVLLIIIVIIAAFS